MKKTILSLLVVSTVLVGCKQDPFPQTGKILQEPPPKPKPVPPPFVLELPESFEYREGEEAIFGVRASVPEPGEPQVFVEGLPDGAMFDPEKLTLTWVPGYDAANDPNDPRVIMRAYNVRFVLRSSSDRLTSISRKAVLVVRDVPRNFNIEVPTTAVTLREGKQHKEIVSVLSDDFPQGPFELQTENLPQSAKVNAVEGDPTKFEITYTPDLKAADVLTGSYDSSGYYQLRDIKLTAIAPSGASVTKKLQWKIFDDRRLPQISAPTELSQSGEVNFVLVAEDINAEMHPIVKIEPAPSFGKLDLQVEKNDTEADGGRNPAVVATVRWTQIPASKIGTSAELNFKVCVYRTKWYKDHCAQPKIRIHFEGNEHPAPAIDRAAWPLAQIRYVRENEELKTRLPIREEGNRVPTVEIFPESMRDVVTWKNDQLVIKPAKTGIQQFNVVATSGFGVKQVESFLYEVLPYSWSRVLILGESPSAPEMEKTVELFDEAGLANPVLQPLDDRLLALRSTLVLGTQTLAMRGLLSQVEKAAAKVRNVVILSPLLENLSGELSEELKNQQVTVGQRFADIADLPELKFFDVRPAGAVGSLLNPTNPIPLAGTLTTESGSPLSLNLGNNRKCSPVLHLASEKAEEPLLVAVRCTRDNGGTLLVSGFEWGDLAPAFSDKTIAKRWMNQLVKP